MRSFEERKEEIFRRSEKRIIRRRKNTWRLIVTCVPLVLCVTVLSGYLAFGGFGRMDSAAPESAFEPNYMVQDSAFSNGSAALESPDEPACAPSARLVALQIGEYRYTDDRTLAEMEMLLDLRVTADDDHLPESIDENTQNGKGDRLTVTLTYADGSRAVYWLEGNRLIGPDTAQVLTREQLGWLESLQEETP